MAHITNHCYQVTARDYGAREPSNLLSFDQLQTAIDCRLGAGALSVRGQLWPRWAEAILNLLSAARGAAEAGAAPPQSGGGARHRRRRGFASVGVDFVLDEHFRSWLIEANTTPGLEGHCAYADAVYGRLLEDTYCLTLDAHFPLPGGGAAPPMEAPAYDDCVVSALPWAASVAREPLPAWASTPWGGWAAGGGGGSREAAPAPHPAPAPHRGNRWQLVWSESPARGALRDIPHQAAMAAAADNAAAVDALAAEEAAGGGGAAAALRLARQHGLEPLLRAVEHTRLAAEAELRGGGGAAAAAAAAAAASAAEGGEAPPPAHWKPVMRRFIRREDAAWLYPLGVPPGELAE